MFLRDGSLIQLLNTKFSVKSAQPLHLSFSPLTLVLLSSSTDGSDYIITDQEKEDKWDMNLARSLELCRERKIFEDFTFYFTPKCTPSRDTLKKIVECHGAVVRLLIPRGLHSSRSSNLIFDCDIHMGQAIFKLPTPRDLASQSNHFVISSPAERVLWEKLATTVPKTPIYTTEAVMRSVLRQESDFTAGSGNRCDLQV